MECGIILYFKELKKENLPIIITGNGVGKAWEILHKELGTIKHCVNTLNQFLQMQP